MQLKASTTIAAAAALLVTLASSPVAMARQLTSAGFPIIFTRDTSVPVKMDQPMVVYFFVNAVAEKHQQDWHRDDILENLDIFMDRPWWLPDRRLIVAAENSPLFRGEFHLTEIPMSAIVNEDIPQDLEHKFSVREQYFLRSKVEEFGKYKKPQLVENAAENERKIAQALYDKFHIKRFFRLTIALPDSFASYLQPKVRVIIRARSGLASHGTQIYTDSHFTAKARAAAATGRPVAAGRGPVLGTTDLIRVLRADNVFDDFVEKLGQLAGQTRALKNVMQPGVNKLIEIQENYVGFPQTIGKLLPDSSANVPGTEEQQQRPVVYAHMQPQQQAYPAGVAPPGQFGSVEFPAPVAPGA